MAEQPKQQQTRNQCGSACSCPGTQRRQRVRINLSELPALPEAAETTSGHSPVESGWLSDGPRVGARVLRRLKGHGYVHAVVRLYVSPLAFPSLA